MEILGIGPLELLFIFLIVLIIFGPRDIMQAGKTLGQGLRKFTQSDTWKIVTQASRKIRSFPDDLMREAGLDEINKSIKGEQTTKPLVGSLQPPPGSLDQTWLVEPPNAKPNNPPPSSDKNTPLSSAASKEDEA